MRRGAAVLLLLVCALVAACSGDEDWLTAQLVDGRVVLTIGGQCDEDSYLSRVDVAVSGVAPRQTLWAASAGTKPAAATPTVTVGVSPPGFRELTRLDTLTWPISVDVWTNFRYVVDIPYDDLSAGHVVKYSPQPVFNELSPVHPARC
ncbi:hypothetical protein ODJ79_28395 [Actinoplanes sp. KI2]|uniref:hypothetical protein n=1 Tax=Actinoplanes sp. KI2 TaxID=2983315 RepID=UPI0021D58554|nr:hypothetical protein [Actinoplanes sp. KI2]MCU7727657.1 hypothetical protein [Actinoplanes sp. KI2]